MSLDKKEEKLLVLILPLSPVNPAFLLAIDLVRLDIFGLSEIFTEELEGKAFLYLSFNCSGVANPGT